MTAYAGRPRPNVQLITLDPFDITPERARIGLDLGPADRAAQRAPQGQDDRGAVDHRPGPRASPWGPVRHRGSSRLHLEGGADSQVWRLFERYGVDLYLAGEAHAATVLEKAGVTQIVHGGLFQFGLTNALLLMSTTTSSTSRSATTTSGTATPPTALGCGRRSAMACHDTSRSATTRFSLGTGVLANSGDLRNASGLLRPGL